MYKLLPIAFVFVIAIHLTTSASSHAENETSGKASSSVRKVPRKDIALISQQIDDLVKQKLRENGQRLNPRVSDEVFLRRVYLDIAGRIPSLDETQAFLELSSRNKRGDLIDRLLDSYGYVSRQYNFWADLLRIKTRHINGISGAPYTDFVKDSLEQNLPYDEFVHELITAEGANFEQGNGAVGYYLRDRNMPEDNMSNTIRVFLGTRLECAQCHDHPYDKWTQRQYFEMVAFTGGLRYFNTDANGLVRKTRSLADPKSLSQRQRQIFRRLGQAITQGVSGSGTGLVRLPKGYLGDEGSEGDIVTAKEMFEGKELLDVTIPRFAQRRVDDKKQNKRRAAQIRGAKQIDSREVYAQWLTDSDNPRFAKVIANRLWKQAFGVGLIEPVDVIEDATVASNPELMDFLTETMIELDFDMKQFLRAIYNTDVYQSTAMTSDVLEASTFYFNGPIVRRMSAEQIWDSLLVLTIPETDKRHQPQQRQLGAVPENPYQRYEMLTKMAPQELVDLTKKLASQPRQRDKMQRKREQENSPEFQAMKKKRRTIDQQIRAARKQKNAEKTKALMLEKAQLIAEFRRKRQSSSLLRASELRSPAPPGHFLREFGQSDREQIDNSNTDPAVTQVLAMMNGYIEQSIARDDSSMLMQAALASRSDRQCTEVIFLSMLNRPPNKQESRTWANDFQVSRNRKGAKGAKEVYNDLIWTLANSNEFIFIK